MKRQHITRNIFLLLIVGIGLQIAGCTSNSYTFALETMYPFYPYRSIPPRWEEIQKNTEIALDGVLNNLTAFKKIDTYDFQGTYGSIKYSADVKSYVVNYTNLRRTDQQFSREELIDFFMRSRHVLTQNEDPYNYIVTLSSEVKRAIIYLDLKSGRILYTSADGSYYGMF